MAITNQQWIDHANQNNKEFSNRNILLKGDGAPSNTTTPAPFGSFYKDKLTGKRYEQTSLVGYDWQEFGSGGSVVVGETAFIAEERTCDSSLAVGDLVWESSSLLNGVDKCTNNTDLRRVIGICIEKPESEKGKILFRGKVSGFSGLSTAMKVYVGEDGRPTATVPVAGYMQIIGDAVSESTFDFSPSSTRVKRL